MTFEWKTKKQKPNSLEGYKNFNNWYLCIEIIKNFHESGTKSSRLNIKFQ